MIAFRRDLHQHPELQFEEFRTTEKSRQFLITRELLIAKQNRRV